MHRLLSLQSCRGPCACLCAAALLIIAVAVLFCGAVGAAAARTGSGVAPRIIFDFGATPSWTQTFHGPGGGGDVARDVVMANARIAYVAGSVTGSGGFSDASLMKLVNGAPAWAQPRRYDGPFHGNDVAHAIALGPKSVVYVACDSQRSSGVTEVLLVKWSKSGRRLWTRRYRGPSVFNHVVDVGVDGAGNVTVAAGSAGDGGMDIALVSWTSSGRRRWVWRYDGPFHGHDQPMEMAVARNGAMYVTGMTQIDATRSGMVTARLSAAGKRVWLRRYTGLAGLGAEAFALAVRPGGGVYVAGSTTSPAGGSDGLVVRYTAKGRRSVFAVDAGAGGITGQTFTDVAVTSTRQVVAVGADEGDCRVVTCNRTGGVAGALSFPSPGWDHFAAVATDAYGGYYVTGSFTVAAGDRKVFTGRGSVLTGGGGWMSLWGPPAISVGNQPFAIAVRDSTVIVAGACTTGAATGVDQSVLGYVY
jgi:hypothetical protein